MEKHLPTRRRDSGLKKVKYVETVSIEHDSTGIMGELEVEEVGVDDPRRGRVLVSGTVLNLPIYSDYIFHGDFVVWEDDIEWL